ncbi:hypothetical protein PHYSODRAFT_260719 [Phytophthora sojae]|uniref:Uncharacterized protein n=1 Tax=Phytophthora sojae (strain P6497) TaxID=1094619 RepID=G4ZM00_PHYSP|nr:hypothetical protein PHYSODRAFT_260719 [Phytophthora sojae]EGZ15629.1 hypothetical protein PHYSODRAFT_260719 [Phytophthora sojae]|eukprot:XP_009529378.1 hypothetical protein PHYSODRAFT_260719 [Phytophthora sojae]
MPGTDATDDTDGMPKAIDTDDTDDTDDMAKAPDMDDTDGMAKAHEIPGTNSTLGVLPKLGSHARGPRPALREQHARGPRPSRHGWQTAAPDLLDTDPMPADPKHPQYGRHGHGFDQAQNGLHARGPVRPGADLMHAATDQPDSGCMPILYYIDLDSTLAVPAKPDTERTFVAIDNFATDGTPAPHMDSLS